MLYIFEKDIIITDLIDFRMLLVELK